MGTMTVAEVTKAALALDDADRLLLLEALRAEATMATPVDTAAIDRAWAKEAESRIAAIESGEMEMIDHEEVMAEMRALLAEPPK